MKSKYLSSSKVQNENTRLKEVVKKQSLELAQKNRELEIEAALEKVRARSLAMQKSEELAEVVAIQYEQITSLKVADWGSNITLYQDGADTFDLWLSTTDQNILPECYMLPVKGHPILKKQWEIWKEQRQGNYIKLKGKHKEGYDQYVLTKTELSRLPEKVKVGIKSTPEIYCCFASMHCGLIAAFNLTGPLSEENFKILQRFATVFEQAYTRFLDLQKAEDQAREAQIETALERVRSRSMAMQKSDELKAVIQVVYDQFVQLKINVEHTGFIIDYKQRDDMHIWLADQHKIPAEVTIPYFDSPHWNSFIEARKKGKDFFTNQLDFKTKNKFYRSLFKLIPGVSKEAIRYYLNCPGLAISTVLLDNVGLYIENFSGTPYTDEENKTLIRFGKVFQQTYTRFLDLQKAEAQVRESEIELATERVRAKALAMHKSEDLLEVAATLRSELEALQIPGVTATTIYLKQENGNIRVWDLTALTQSDEGFHFSIDFEFDMKTTPADLWFRKPWKSKKKYFIITGTRKEFFASAKWLKQFDKEYAAQTYQFIKTSKLKETWHPTVSLSNGRLCVDFIQPPPQEMEFILLKIGASFDLAYKRFLDLQKAEAQIREVKIEMALEKVRSRTMAMQQSDELPEAANLLFLEVQALGIPAWSAGYNILAEDKKSCTCIMSSEGILQEPFTLHLIGEASFVEMFDFLKGEEHFLVQELGGKDLQKHYDYMKSFPELKGTFQHIEDNGLSLPTYQINHLVKYTYGFLLFITYEQVPDAHDLFMRFTKVFEQTYTRFLDLKKAETQARESEIELALERVRARTMAMHKSEELKEVIKIVIEQFIQLGFHLDLANINYLGKSKDWEMWLAVPGFAYQEKIHIPYLDHPLFNRPIETVSKGIDFLADTLTFKEKNSAWKHILNSTIAKKDSAERKKYILKSKGLARSAIFKKYTALTISNFGAIPYSNEENVILRRFADVFEQSYIRFLDIQKAEEQNRESQIEVALEKVRSRSLAMHTSEELAEVGNTVFDQLKQLGIHAETSWFWFVDLDNDEIEFWVTHKNKLAEPISANASDYPTFKRELKAWKNKEPYLKLTIPNKEAVRSIKELFGVKISGGKGAQSFHLLQARHQYGFLGFGAWREATDEQIKIYSRFAGVFEQAYTRFLDLQKAEAQAREAQIEAALERVRSQSLAMHQSDELSNVIEIIFQQFVLLGLKLDHADFVLGNHTEWTEQIRTFWVATMGRPRPIKISMPYIDHQIFIQVNSAIKSGKDFLEDTYGLKEKNSFFKKWFEHLPQENRILAQEKKVFESSGYSRSIVFLENIELVIGKFEPNPFSVEENLILKRFAKVFEQTYTRFLDLQKAEAQAREAQIETSLERVRSKTMAMHNSQDVGNTIATLFEELVVLGLEKSARCGIVIMNDSNITEVWAASNNTKEELISIIGTLDMTIHPLLEGVIASWKNKKQSFTYTLRGADLIKYYKALNDYPDYPIHVDIKSLPKKTVHNSFSFTDGVIFSFTPNPISDEFVNVFNRFASVFGQTYKRYLDLKKAEAQAREAKIEAALERVRSRSMAMHKSEELLDVITVVSEQLQELDFKFNHVSFANNDLDQDYKFWVSARGIPKPMRFTVPYFDIPLLNNMRAGQKKGTPFYTDILTKKENRQWHTHLLNHGGAKIFTKEVNEYALSRGMARSIAINPNIILILANYASVPYLESENKIIARFGQVFEQSYTRFLDLQRAETQVREAQIEASLERVRSKAMAMHSSQDLSNTIGTFYKELEVFNLVPRRCGVGLLNKDSREGEVYTWNTAENGESLELVGKIQMEGHPVLENVYNNWLTKTDYHPILKGNEIKEYYKVIRPQMAFPDYNHDEVHYGYFLMFEEGGVYAWKETPLKDDELKIYRRFTSVLSLTYKRYKDLMAAEARALLAVREASLDRVRGEIASMRTAEDLKRITPLLWRELSALGVPFFRCGLMIVDEETDHVQFYLSTPDGKPLAALDLPINDFDLTQNGVTHWRSQKVFIVHWDQAQFIAFTKSLVDQGHIKDSKTYQGGEVPPASLTMQFVPFPQGMLYVGSENALSANQIDLVQALADAFSTAYARYEDFTNLEAAKTQIEKALSDLQETQKQLIQSEKMASLGELTAGIAHEIQNPLNFVNNFSEVSNELIKEIQDIRSKTNDTRGKTQDEVGFSEEDELLQDIASNLEKILHHGKRADGIVKGMLQHSKSSTGKKEATDINVLCDEYLRLAYHGLRAKDKSFNAKFETHFDTTLENVNVVPQDIGRVVLNLITNAFYAVNVKTQDLASPQYTPTVVVSTTKEGNAVLISVEDNGNGIPESIKEKIFQPFFTTKPTGQGTGLGLSLSYDIVKAHGGELMVESEEGEGSQFILQLPILT